MANVRKRVISHFRKRHIGCILSFKKQKIALNALEPNYASTAFPVYMLPDA